MKELIPLRDAPTMHLIKVRKGEIHMKQISNYSAFERISSTMIKTFGK